MCTDFDDLDTVPTATKSTKAAADHPQFPCQSCGGSGVFRGVRVHQPESRCFACGGRGYFKTSQFDRNKARQRTHQRKLDALEAAKAETRERYGELLDRARAEISWHTFSASVVGQFDLKGTISDRQAVALSAALDKVDAGRAVKLAERAKEAAAVPMAAIEAMFATAKASGLKRPRFTANGLTLSPAKEGSRNAGAIYVKKDGDYLGKIAGGAFTPAWGVTGIADKLAEIAEDPAGFARSHGKETGKCCCCGRELTDPVSVANGIGPICESNWF